MKRGKCVNCGDGWAHHAVEGDPCWGPVCAAKDESDRCSRLLYADREIPSIPDVTEPRAAQMNEVGSETGRVFTDAPASSVSAAHQTKAKTHREVIRVAVKSAGSAGLTSIEAAALLPATRQGGSQVSNRSASRLDELWEAGEVAVLRQNGVCVLGQCQQHKKPDVVHRPTATCWGHGEPVTRDGANVWVAIR